MTLPRDLWSSLTDELVWNLRSHPDERSRNIFIRGSAAPPSTPVNTISALELNVITSFLCPKGSRTSAALGVSSANGGARQAGLRASSSPRPRHRLQTPVLVLPVLDGVVQEGLLLWRHALRLIFAGEADHLRLRGPASSVRLGAVANAVAEVDREP